MLGHDRGAHLMHPFFDPIDATALWEIPGSGCSGGIPVSDRMIPRLRNTTATTARELRHVLRAVFPLLAPADLYGAARIEAHTRLGNPGGYRYTSYDMRRNGPQRAWQRAEEKRVFLELLHLFPSLSLRELMRIMKKGRHLVRVGELED